MTDETADLHDIIEQERHRNAACLTAAEGHLSAFPDDFGPGHPFWSPAVQAVIDLRASFDKIRELWDQMRLVVDPHGIMSGAFFAQPQQPTVEPTDQAPATDWEWAWPIGTPVWYRRYGDGPWEQSTTKTVPWLASGVAWVTVESTPAQAGAALTLGGLRTLDNPPPDTELEPPTTPL